MIDCKVLPVNLLLLLSNNCLQNRTHHKKYIQNDISHEDSKKQNYSGFALTRMFYPGVLKTESFGLYGFRVFDFLRVFWGGNYPQFRLILVLGPTFYHYDDAANKNR